jgi:hypothetical protein
MPPSPEVTGSKMPILGVAIESRRTVAALVRLPSEVHRTLTRPLAPRECQLLAVLSDFAVRAHVRPLIQSEYCTRCSPSLGSSSPRCFCSAFEFVGPFEPRGWKLVGPVVPLAYIGWSMWLLALGIGLLITD